MAYEGWMEYDGVALIDVARTVALSRAMGIDTVRVNPASVAWLSGGAPYSNVANAPWYDAQYPASAEFAGFIPLSVDGLDNSTRESTAIEYTTDGGHAGRPRNATLPVVFNLALIAKTEAGAEYGKRWLDRVLRGTGALRPMCLGADLRYFRWAGDGAPLAHRRDVRLSRGTSVTRKRRSACAATWMVTFTLTAADPYEYGEPEQKITSLGGATATGPGVTSQGILSLNQVACPKFDYTPIYDPFYPSLIPPPAAPDFLPSAWDIGIGNGFTRQWARITPTEPSMLNVVPVIRLTSTEDVRTLRVSVWPGTAPVDSQCDPLFGVVVTYLPANRDFYIDGEQRASYVLGSTVARRTDSLVYAPDANPVQWAAFNDHNGLLVTLDNFESGGTVRASLDLVAKSD